MTSKPKTETPEQRIIYFIDVLKDSGVIRFKKEFFDKTAIRRQHYVRVKNGEIRFTSTQIKSICEHYNINANWIFGTETNVFKHTPKSTLLEEKK